MGKWYQEKVMFKTHLAVEIIQEKENAINVMQYCVKPLKMFKVRELKII